MPEAPDPSRRVPDLIFRNDRFSQDQRIVAEESAVALSYGGSTEAVMMATPADLEDFAIGFSLSEGIVTGIDEIEAIAIEPASGGVDLQIALRDDLDVTLRARRRAKAGPVGCGLCGVESIEEALKPAADVSAASLRLAPADIARAMAELTPRQPLNTETRAVHAAAFYIPGQGLVAVREDVGRHNALDKLIGALARAGVEGASGAVIMTSRLSVELVQKTAKLGSGALIGISAPTALAIDMAARAGMTLVALARGEDFDIFTGADRIITGDKADAA
ncbi:formate dehydrogenase accessory sulfurtransferase FdhD [Rhizobium sp. TRM95796]|uniref:formate dehydrogenase accessory sulfurtransferase FdhD n=1 Tax=Rhizobium sp. TRM95796 TaxID=2979862 RepID=UPI0021E6EE49|nr:formate dehydrogenase accessory sulfurtransferase FdhD [Rhizobium sp. TRM95796]MCV3767561.1 formate dehydrogenase accessory sulfurtransferase FdhD [Rhizobium sp. TRM95796]